MLKILQVRLQWFVSHEIPDIQAVYKRQRKQRSNWQHPLDNAREFQKISISALLTMPKPLTVWITISCGKSERDGNPRPPDLPLEKPICRSESNS